MHDTAAAFGAAFFRCYADTFDEARILEVGAGDVNGTLRGCAPHHSKYTGIDLAAGPGVDVVLSDPYTYPFEPESYDFVVSSSCLEHDQMFWLSFAEMCRVLKEGGFIYLNVPSNGTFHRYPTDNWRFYPDSGLALVSWGRRNGHDIRLVESFIGRRQRDIWNDCVMVFGKGDTPRQLSLLAELFPRSFNIRIGEQDRFSNYCESTEDMTLRAWLTKKFEASSPPNGHDSQTSPIEALLMSLAEREVALDATERAAKAQIAGLRSELAAREAALEAAAAGLQRAEAETANLRTALDERGAAQAATLEAVRAELASVQSALADRDGAATALAVALAQREAGLTEAQNELESLRRAGQEQADAIDGLRRRVASLQYETDERTATAAAMQAELRSLRDELAAARQVSRSLLAALRTGSAAATAADQPGRHAPGIFHLSRHWTGHARG